MKTSEAQFRARSARAKPGNLSALAPRLRNCGKLLLLAAAASGCGQAVAQAAPAPSRGQLLYATHCIECHNSQMHWRDKKLATDWPGLKAQVRHWQARALLNWSEADIVEVARHLNESIYRFAQSSDLLGQAGGPRPRP